MAGAVAVAGGAVCDGLANVDASALLMALVDADDIDDVDERGDVCDAELVLLPGASDTLMARLDPLSIIHPAAKTPTHTARAPPSTQLRVLTRTSLIFWYNRNEHPLL